MPTVYKKPRRDGSCRHIYQCRGDYHLGGTQCGPVPGAPLDQVVVDAIHRRLSPPAVDIIKAAWEQEKANEHSEHHRRELELHRARQAEAEAAYRYNCVDAANRLVAAGLERGLETAKREVRKLERLLDRERNEPEILDDAAFDELRDLCKGFAGIWNASTTTNHDRKELIRTMVKEVGMEARDREKVQLRIVWEDEEPDIVAEAILPGYSYKLIADLAAQGVEPAEIARRLNEQGLRTMKNRPWREVTVAKAVKRLATRAKKEKAGR